MTRDVPRVKSYVYVPYSRSSNGCPVERLDPNASLVAKHAFVFNLGRVDGEGEACGVKREA